MKSNHARRGFSLIELLIVIAIIMTIAAIAVGPMTKALMAAREMAAVREIGVIHQAQTQYNSQFGRYAAALAELGPPTSGADGPAGAGLIPSDLAGGKKSGHIFTLSATPNGYTVAVAPEKFGNDGRRTFYSDQTLVIRNNWGQEPATPASPEIK